MVYYGRCINGEYCIRGKELGSILLRHRITERPHDSGFIAHSKFPFSKRIKKVADSYAGFTGYVWTWKFFNSDRKSR